MTRPPWDGGLVRSQAHGPLPILLLALTFTTGSVDAVSVLSLGRVFVANMTGNIVFIGFALARAPGFSLLASVAALAGFLCGALVGGVLVDRRGHRRGRVLLEAVLASLILTGAAATVLGVAIVGNPAEAVTALVAVLLAVALGLQNSVVRHLAVPDLTTTVLTMTLTGIASDIRISGRRVVVRRLLAVAVMLLGALVGALLVIHAGPAWALSPTLVVAVAVIVILAAHERRPAPWQQHS